MIARRTLLAATAATALPRFAVAQSDDRPALTVAVQKIANTNTLDPLREQSSNASERYTALVLETPIGRNQQGVLERVPGLATAWRRVDARTVELDIRPDVRLHDGRTLTAEDVAWSLGPRMLGPAGAIPEDCIAVARRHFPALERVEATGPLTVRVVNRTPDLTLEGRLSAGGSEVWGQAAYEAKGAWTANNRAPVGTGPYRVAEFRPDTSLTLVAHDAYWGGRPPYRQVRFVEVPELASRLNGLRSGEYDIACDLDADAASGVDADGPVRVVGAPVNNHRIIVFDKSHPALRDPRVRLAMAHAVDGQAIADGLWAGRATVPPGLQFPFYGDMLVPGWTVPPYDPARAQALLKEGGYHGEPIPYRIRNNYYAAEVATAQVVAEMWKAVGINAAIEVDENWAQVLDRSKPRGARDWSNSATFDDPVSSIVAQHGPNGAQQTNGEWTNAEMNALSPELESGTDPARRRQVFARMLQICEREDPAYIVLHRNAVFTGVRRGVRWRPSPSFLVDLSPRGVG